MLRLNPFLVWLKRKLSLWLRGRELYVAGRCRMCGDCCRELTLVIDGAPFHNVKEFKRVLKEHPDYERLRIVGRDAADNLVFTCDWLTPEGLCKDHENRLDLCRGHPSLSIYFRGGDLAEHCGFRFEEIKPFDKTLRRTLKQAGQTKKSPGQGPEHG
ncbi:MAG: YkgJ family cysteine cluster protein [Desulfovibrionaceae bacterium]